MSIFDLEKHFAFYGAYHSNPVNIFIHMLFVWPIFYTSLMLFYHVPILFFPNFAALFTLIYAFFYVGMDKKAGSLAALLCFLCWVGASSCATHLGYSLTWKVFYVLEFWFPDFSVIEYLPLWCHFFSLLSAFSLGPREVSWSGNWESLIYVRLVAACISIVDLFPFSRQVVLGAQLICWTAQFIGHGVFEKRAPALLDNLVQAFLMAPFFVLLEALQHFFGYEPYPGFHAKVKAMVDAEIKEWRDKKEKKLT